MAVDIVVAEDDQSIGHIVKTRLQKAGLKVVWEFDGQSALDAIAQSRPKVVLLDLMMPVMGGFEVLEKLKADPALKDIPVLVFSARTGGEDVQKALALGAKDFLVKPFLPSDLEKKVRHILGEG